VQFAVAALKMGHKIGKLLGMEPNAVGFGFGTQSKSIK